MSRIPEHLVQEIVARTDFVAVMGQYLTLRPRQGRLLALCPFHAEKTPSFNVNPERGMWYCFGCHIGGDLFNFLMKMEGWTFHEAAREMGRRVGIDVDQLTPEERRRLDERQRLQDVIERASTHFHQLLKTSPSAEAARRYLVDRGIGEAIIDAFQLGYAPAGPSYLLSWMSKGGYAEADVCGAGLATDPARGRVVDMFRDRVTFPILDPHGRAIAMGGRMLGDGQPKYLNSPETSVFSKRNNLYGLFQARSALRSDPAILVEGYMDVVALHQAGFPQAVASLGTSLTAEQANLLRRYSESCVLAYDADNAGQSATTKGIEIFETASLPVRVIELPAGEDPDSLIRKCGQAAFRERLDAARGIVEHLMETLARKLPVGTPEGKTRFLNEMLPALGRVRDMVRWDEYVHLISERLRLREETVRKLASTHLPPGSKVSVTPQARPQRREGPYNGPRREWSGPGQRRPGPPPMVETTTPTARPAVTRSNKLARAEEDLLRFLLAHPSSLERARPTIAADDFTDPDLRAILQALYALPEPPRRLAAGDLVPLLQQEGVHKRLSELFVDSKSDYVTPELFDGLLKSFQVRRDEAEFKRLSLKFARDAAQRDDPEFARFQELLGRMKGS